MALIYVPEPQSALLNAIIVYYYKVPISTGKISLLQLTAMKLQLFTFLKGILAGLAIGVGGFLYILMIHFVGGELGNVLSSILFAVGLFTVCTFYLALYTGKIGLVFEKKQEKSFYISLPVMLLGNIIGAVSLGYICYAIFRGNTEIMNTVAGVCAKRVTLFEFSDYLSLMVRSFLCGLCVYLAVKCFNFNRLKPVGIILLVTFVFVFVYSGFQHCIANMYYLGFGNQYGNGYAYVNLAFCILFNSLGTIPGVLIFKIVKK